MDSVVVKDALDTALLTASYRALATERPDGRIQDPYARMLTGERGKELQPAIATKEMEMWAIVIRTKVYDTIILRLVKKAHVDTVINLAAGLDSRPYRLALPKSLRWVEIDHPEVLTYKQEKLAQVQASCIVEQVPLDITDDEARRAALTQATRESKRTLVLTEGLLLYLPHETVISLAHDLREQPPICWWLTEILPNSVTKQHRDIWNKITSSDVQTRFSPTNGMLFFPEYGWDFQEFRYIIREIVRYKIPFKIPYSIKFFVHFLPRIPTSTYGEGGFALLKPTGKSQDEPAPVGAGKNVVSSMLRIGKSVLHLLGLW